MTNNECLMVVAMEECAEIQQAISKSLRFGLNNYHPNDPSITNGDQIVTECAQLWGVMTMLIEAGVLPYFSATSLSEIARAKKEKVAKYMELSQKLGCVEE